MSTQLNLFVLVFIVFCSLSYGGEDYKTLKDFKEVLNIINEQYIDKVDNEKLIENAISGMLNSLDPYSIFLNKKEYENTKLTTNGEFGGIGVEISMEQGFLKVMSAYTNLPADRAGIKAGDIIMMVNDEPVSNMGIAQISDRLKGEPNSKVKVKIYRNSGEIKELIITREIIKLTPIKVIFYNQDKIIYARIAVFNEKTDSILRSELQRIVRNYVDIKGLILDIRDNPGGIMDQAVKVSRLFLSKGKIVSLRTRYSSDDVVYEATGHDIMEGMPIVILINNGSASASEIVAGALQDNQRALIVGERSFCKGLVQNLIPFDNGYAIKLTTAKFYTPLGRSIQEDCIIPDIEILSPSNDSSYNRNSRQSISKKHSFKDISNDYQLQRAIDLIKGISLYNGSKMVLGFKK